MYPYSGNTVDFAESGVELVHHIARTVVQKERFTTNVDKFWCNCRDDSHWVCDFEMWYHHVATFSATPPVECWKV